MPLPSSTQTTQASVSNAYPAAPLHYVNIGHKLDGDYKFGYDTGKGPLGQSFREEIRLADGTISGTYGVVDELGHKRLVHFSAGKTGLFSQEEPSSKAMKELPSSTPTPPQPRFVQKPSSKAATNHFTAPFSSFGLVNYLQSQTTASVPKSSTPIQHNIIQAPQTNSLLSKQSTSTQNNMVLVSQVNSVTSTKPSTTTQHNMVSLPQTNSLHLSQQPTSIQYNTFSSHQTKSLLQTKPSSPTQHNIVHAPQMNSLLRKPSADIQNNMAQVSQMNSHLSKSSTFVETNGISDKNQKAFVPFMESYRLTNLQRQAKVETPNKMPSLKKMETIFVTSTYDPKIEDEYYDSAPPFIDVERLSYNIGTDKNASSKI
ncbi:uncharacterized protein TNCT_18011 [Trichonephila clavata]|uniref:Uncharacterized protein n=1 Tax=Trichonephila clavata TaxID=2740835 RepID=A0A8X6GFI3_TRICU|nr:uncharacterized protein TNCT_18011 [Trichonephila clavata]